MHATDDRQPGHAWSGRSVRWLRVIVPALVAGTLVLFPFDWLADVSPAYARVFDVVFASALAHHIGHATIFFLAGLLALYAVPVLRARPPLYVAVLAFGALGEEALQSVFKLHLPTLGDGRDLLFDLAGFVVAYVAGYVYTIARNTR